MTLNQRIHEFLDVARPYIELPDMRQALDSWWDEYGNEAKECCIGARIAKAFNLSDDPEVYGYFYTDGISKMRDNLSITPQQLDFVLYICGANADPFSASDWNYEPEFVMSKLSEIEWIPTEKWINEYWNIDNEEAREQLQALMSRTDIEDQDLQMSEFINEYEYS